MAAGQARGEDEGAIDLLAGDGANIVFKNGCDHIVNVILRDPALQHLSKAPQSQLSRLTQHSQDSADQFP